MASNYMEPQAREKNAVAPAVTSSNAVTASQEQLQRGFLERINRVIDTDPNRDHLHISDTTQRRTQFDELVVGQETTTFSLSSQWNALELRNQKKLSGSATITNNSQGEYELRTGTTINSSASLVSHEAGVYEPGTTAVIGVGARITEKTGSYSNSEDAKWGYFDEENGFGFGVDSTDLYIFRRRDGSDTKIYRDNWSNDSLDGNGPSGYDLTDLRDIFIFQVEYTWYGSGEMGWFLAKRSGKYDLPTPNRILLHVEDPTEDDNFNGPSILQPDLPFHAKVSNSGSTNDKGLSITGRAFRRIDQEGTKQRRSPAESLVDYSNLTQDQYKPVFALTKKDTFNGFPNQVNTRFKQAEFATDQDVSFRIEIGEDLLSGSTTLKDVDTWGSNSSVQVAKGDNITLNSGSEGFVFSERVLRGATNQGSSKKTNASDDITLNTAIGRQEDLIIQARQDTSNTTTISVTSEWSESF